MPICFSIEYAAISYGWCYLAVREPANYLLFAGSRTGKLFAISRSGRNPLRLEQICVLGLERVVKRILEWQFQSDFINVLRLTIQELNTENSYAHEDLGP